MSKKVWIVRGDSESGDHYEPKRYDHKPSDEELKKYIIEETPELCIVMAPRFRFLCLS